MVRRKFAQREYRFGTGMRGRHSSPPTRAIILGKLPDLPTCKRLMATGDNEIQDGVPYSREALAQLSRILGSLPGLSRSFGMRRADCRLQIDGHIVNRELFLVNCNLKSAICNFLSFSITALPPAYPLQPACCTVRAQPAWFAQAICLTRSATSLHWSLGWSRSSARISFSLR